MTDSPRPLTEPRDGIVGAVPQKRPNPDVEAALAEVDEQIARFKANPEARTARFSRDEWVVMETPEGWSLYWRGKP